MLGLEKLLTKELRFKLIKFPFVRKLIIRKNKGQHLNKVYSLIMFSRMFEVDWYLDRYPDVGMHQIDPIKHYIEHGAKENRNPTPWFSTKTYKEAHLLESSENPFLHFLLNQNVIPQSNLYNEWLNLYSQSTDEIRKKVTQDIKKMIYLPLISVVIPVYNADIHFLKKAIKSIKEQVYTNWEICIADDASSDKSLLKYLKSLTKHTSIKVKFRKENGHISEATNSALELAEGEFIAFMDQDDELSVDALFEVVKALNKKPELNLIYSDEDKINEEEKRFDPHFKSDWNRMLFYSQNYISHLTVVRKKIADKIGGLRKGYEGSQDYDFLLRYIEQIEENTIYHIPKVLYHWRAIEGSTALSIEGKSYAVEAGRKALSDHIHRTYLVASVDLTCSVYYKVNFPIAEPPPLVSIIIPFKDKVELLQECLSSIFQKSSYEHFEILLIDNNSSEKNTLEYLKSLVNNPIIRQFKYSDEFNYSAINNFASRQAKGDILLLLNNDISIISENWLEEMISYFSLKDVAVVGAKLLFDDDTIQHAGIILGIGGVAGHPHKFQKSEANGYMNRAKLTQNLSAVTAACMAIRKNVFMEVNGLDEKLKVAFNDVDLCMRIREKGYMIVFTPFAQMYHYESKSRGDDNAEDKIVRFKSEIRFMKKRWGEKLFNDPYYNNNLSIKDEQFQLAFPPRNFNLEHSRNE